MLKDTHKLSALALASTLALSGCFGGGGTVKKEELSRVRTIGIGTVTIARIAPNSQPNNQVLQATAERALGLLQSGLGTVSNWRVIDSARYKGKPQFTNIGNVSEDEVGRILKASIQSQVAGQNNPNMGGAFGARMMEMQQRVIDREVMMAKRTVQRQKETFQKDYVAAAGFAPIPYSGLFAGESESSQITTKIYRQQIREAAKAAGVGALAFFYVHAKSSHPARGQYFITQGNRTDGTIHMEMTAAIFDKNGELLAAMGDPFLDDLDESESLLPMYVGKGKNAIKFSNINLKDKKGKVRDALFELVDETTKEITEDLRDAVKG